MAESKHFLTFHQNNVEDETSESKKQDFQSFYDNNVKDNALEIETELFIKKGIETLIMRSVYLIKNYAHAQISLSKSAESIKKELYKCNDKSSILNVGSFYEGTKNNFPDEFDFIFILETFIEVHGDIEKYRYLAVSDTFIDEIVNILSTKELVKHLKYKESKSLESLDSNSLESKPLENLESKSLESLESKSLESLDSKSLESKSLLSLERKSPESKNARKISFEKVVRVRGPGVKLKYKFKNTDNTIRSIYADLTPAFKIETDDLSLYVDNLCSLPQFAEEIVEDKTYLILKNGSVTFTETEVRFMKDVLSEKHRRVYQTLKYLINGHDGEKLEESNITNRPSFGISSYRIKCVMISHHYEVCNANTETDCLLELTERLHKCHKEDKWINISCSNLMKRDSDRDCVDRFIRNEGVKALEKIYAEICKMKKTENFEIQPVATSLLETLRSKYFINEGVHVFMKESFFRDPDK